MLSSLGWNLLLTAALAIGLAGLCRLPALARRPALRHWLWLLLLAKLVTPPLIAVPLLPAIAGSEHPAAMATPPSEPMGRPVPAFDQPAVEEMPSVSVSRHIGEVATQELHYRPQTLLLAGLLAVSLLGTCVLLTVHGVHAVKLYRWLSRAGTENRLLAESCAEVASSLAVRGIVRSCVVEARTTPLLLGWGRPLVVVPRQFIDELSPQQLRSIVAHELAHLLRRDHWVNAFVMLVKALLWWNPVVWWADRELRAAQELCCDAMTIACCQANRRSYATTLLKALDFIQAEPLAPRALATGMGSRGTILRRFKMIGERHVSYQLSRWTFLALLVLAIPLVCIPVRGQEKSPAAAPAAAVPAPPKAEPAKTAKAAETQPLDPKIRELGDAVHKRLTAWTDTETLVLKNGQTARMKVKKNITPVAAIQITPHFVEQGTTFDLEGVDAGADIIGGTKCTSMVIHNSEGVNMGLEKGFVVGGESIIAKIHLSPTRLDKDTVRVQVKALFTRIATSKEIEAMLLTQGKDGQLHLNFQTISRWVVEFKAQNGRYPKDLKELGKPLPKDVYSRTGEDYHYEAQAARFVLSSCGKDGIYGNADDEIYLNVSNGITSGQRRGLYPLEKEKAAAEQKEMVGGVRPRGNCSISGKCVSAADGKPIVGARMYLHYNVTHASIFVNTAADGTFLLKDIPQGPYSLRMSRTPGYQDAIYDPDGKAGAWPDFSLDDGEHRTGIVLKAAVACRVSGKIVDEQGNVPEDIEHLTVLAWFKKAEGAEGTEYGNEHAQIKQSDGSYVLDGLANRPVYVMAIDWQGGRQGDGYPPIYYPGTFSRNDAKLITFDKSPRAENINITLRKEGGLILEGTVRDEAGKPVPEAFVVAHRPDMLFDFITAYSDAQGHYQIQGLGEGEFLVHVDAVHRGFVRTRTPVTLEKKNSKTQQDFKLNRGVLISGKFVDEKGHPWQIGTSWGHAYVDLGERHSSSFSLTSFRNKHRPPDAQHSSGGGFALGEGDYNCEDMLFPTKSTFILQGMMPGETKLSFSPNKEKQEVLKILHGDEDIMDSGIETKPGQEIKDVTIVIGTH